MHPLCGALPVPFVLARVTRVALIAHRYSYKPPRCRTFQYSRTFIPHSLSQWNYLVDSMFDGVGLAGFTRKVNALLLSWAGLSLYVFPFFLTLPFFFGLALWGSGLRTDRVHPAL